VLFRFRIAPLLDAVGSSPGDECSSLIPAKHKMLQEMARRFIFHPTFFISLSLPTLKGKDFDGPCWVPALILCIPQQKPKSTYELFATLLGKRSGAPVLMLSKESYQGL
jgi:hypothetical protein